MISSTDIVQFLLEDILRFHEELGRAFVMEPGIHDEGLLESAVNAPFQTFAGQDLYEGIYAKAAQLCYGLTKDHPFRDGNKRTAVHSMLVYLGVNNIELEYEEQAMEDLIISVADGRTTSQQLCDWLKLHTGK